MTGRMSDKYFKYGVMVMTKSNEVCWVSLVKGSTVATEKGLAWLGSKDAADECALRLYCNGVSCCVCKIADGLNFGNERDFKFGEYKLWFGENDGE